MKKDYVKIDGNLGLGLAILVFVLAGLGFMWFSFSKGLEQGFTSLVTFVVVLVGALVGYKLMRH